MKTVCKLLVLLVLFSCTYAKATDEFVNNKNVSIAKTEYTNLLNLGFTDNEILNMNKEEFDANKDLVGTIVSQSTVDVIDNSKYKLKSNGYVNNPDKKMTTTIISMGSYYRYKVTVEWKMFPSIRSYDIIGIGINNNVKINSSLYFQISYCIANNCSSNNVFTHKITSSGGTGIFKLPNGNLTSMNAYLYFNVAKNTGSTITQLQAAGDYAHAMRSVTLTKAKKHAITRIGLILENSIFNYYDDMSTAMATLSCNW